MRIMELYRIESEYKGHQKRLATIREASSLQKIKRVTHQQSQKATDLKKIKAQDLSFQQREEQSRREHTLQLMNRTLDGQFRKIKAHYEPQPTHTRTHLATRTHFYEPSSSRQEYTHLLCKLEQIKKQPRRRQAESQRRGQREAVVELMRRQFKIEPRVVYPRVRQRGLSEMVHTPSNPELQAKQPKQ